MSTQRHEIPAVQPAPPSIGRAWLVVLFVLVAPASADDRTEFFESMVRPILVEKCQGCHGPDKQKGGLRVDTKAAILQGGDTGPAAETGSPDDSPIVMAVRYDDDLKMPPRSKLADSEIQAIERWVRDGLAWPESPGAAVTVAGPIFDVAARRQAHWAWQAVEAPSLPVVQNTAWPADPIDRFILAGLETKGLRPAPDAERQRLIRRLSFDLTGLPPTWVEVAAFDADRTPDAYEKVVDRLLTSPRFGERWARHWLDLVRYAETRGHEFDPAIPNAYQYRDYLIRAFNADVPYDQFVREHLAGDLLPQPRKRSGENVNESILATGSWFLGEEVHSPVDIRQDECDRIDNRLDVFGKTFLGMTIACARCHDHKFDAIAQKDYYALAGFLLGSTYRQARFETMETEKALADRLERLRGEARRHLSPAFARNRRPNLETTAALLAASVELIRGGSADLPYEDRWARVDAFARKAGFDPDRLSRWMSDLARSKTDARHPLAPFLKLALADPGDFQTLRETLSKEARERIRVASAPAGQVVVDFASLPAESWRADGFGFGTRVLRPGDLLLRGDVDRPRIELIDRAAAYRDSTWPAVKVAKDDQRDHGTLGTWDRSGQTLLTPNFRLGSGKLWYLVRGPIRAYAAVDSHTLIAGPLHAALLAERKGDDDWHWVGHDLSAYAGHRVHLEFSPGVAEVRRGQGGGPGPNQNFGGPPTVAVAMVVEADEPPPLPAEPVDRLTVDVLEDPGIVGIESLAVAYQARLLAASTWLGRGELENTQPTSTDAFLAQWIQSRSTLFESPDLDLRTDLAEILTLQNEILRRVPAESHTAPALLDGNGVDEALLVRGNSRSPGAVVPRRSLEAIDGGRLDPIPSASSGRLQLAERIAAAENPLTARVFVNRIWHHLIGRGIVASVDNFGVLGDAPSHPELLDHLADRFTRDGWSTKRLIRAIVLSRTYRMASLGDEAADSEDPDNRLLHKARLRRLEGEAIRDAILCVSKQLDETAYGPSIPVHLTGFMQGRGRPGASGPLDGGNRRSLYLEIRRNFLSPFLLAFDAPIPFSTMGKRNVSNVPAQALILLNDPFVIEQAGRWADRVLAEGPATADARIRSMYRAAFSRDPDDEEIARAAAFLSRQAEGLGIADGQWAEDRRPWADLGHVLFNAKEFLFLE